MSRLHRIGGLFAALLTSFTAHADLGMNMTKGVTDLSHEIYGLHMTVIWVCVAIGVLVFGVMIYSMVNHRKSKGFKAATFHESTLAEIGWTIVPVAILVALAIPAAQALIKIEDSSDADMTIKVTGHQWKWEYDYPEQGIHFFSNLDPKSREASARDSGIDPSDVDHYLLNVDKPLVIPTGKKVRFLFTSNDVIHAWWVPDLAVKKDAIPGFINDMWAKVNEPGTYRGQCAELCGKDHGFMPIVVVAKDEAGFNAWVAEQKSAAAAEAASADKEWTMDDLMAKGETIYANNCAACHQANGAGIPGVFPGLAGSPIVKGDVKGHIDIVMHGKAGTAMAAYAAQLSDADMAAVITYERNAFGNDTGDVVQPSTIKAAR